MVSDTNRQLDATEIIRAITKLRQRIKERFPDRNLENVCASLLAIAKDSKEKIEWINTPNILLRMVVGLIVLAAILAFIASLRVVDISMSEMHLLDVVTLLEAGMNDLVLIGAALFFLFTIESRIKRNRSIKALNEIRSIAHVIDMHQLTKDPSFAVIWIIVVKCFPSQEKSLLFMPNTNPMVWYWQPSMKLKN